jgi:hypothetical protein
MRWWLGLVMASLVAMAPAPSIGAEIVKLEGTWNVLITHGAGGCAWMGQVTLTQNVASLEGEGWAATDENSKPGCAPLLEGNVAGVIEGRVVQLGFGTGALGVANFRGLILKGEGDMTGWWSAEGAGGDWTASRAQQ